MDESWKAGEIQARLGRSTIPVSVQLAWVRVTKRRAKLCDYPGKEERKAMLNSLSLSRNHQNSEAIGCKEMRHEIVLQMSNPAASGSTPMSRHRYDGIRGMISCPISRIAQPRRG